MLGSGFISVRTVRRSLLCSMAGVLALTAFIASTGCAGRSGGSGLLFDPPREAVLGAARIKTSPELLAAHAAIRRELASAPLRDASVSLLVVGMDDGADWASVAADVPRRPASVAKLFTVAAALENWAADYRFATAIHLLGEIEHGTLDGALVVEGRGAPSLASAELASAIIAVLARAGVERIHGELIVDDGAGDAGFPPAWEVGDLAEPWAAPAGTLALDDAVVTVELRPAPLAGQPALVQWLDADGQPWSDAADAPELPGLRDLVQVDVGTIAPRGPARLRHEVLAGAAGLRPRLVGDIPTDARPRRVEVAAHHTGLHAGALLARQLARRGMPVAGPLVVTSLLPPHEQQEVRARWAEREPEALHHSPTLAEIIRPILKDSRNQMAEMLLLALGTKAGAAPDGETLRMRGLREVDRALRASAAGAVPARMVDGSGLSWRNLATARQVVELLRHVHSTPHARLVYEALPVAGVDGTMQHRWRSGRLLGNLRAKTGYLPHTRSFAGTFTTAGGTRLAFALMVENYTAPTGDINAAAERMLAALAEMP